jgi:hypothetical protein
MITRNSTAYTDLAAYYAFGYFAAAMRREIPAVLSKRHVRNWLIDRMSSEGKATLDVKKLTAAVYSFLEKVAVKEDGNSA